MIRARPTSKGIDHDGQTPNGFASPAMTAIAAATIPCCETAPMSDWPNTLVLAGAGKMGGAMLKGWLMGGLPAAGVAIVEPTPSPEILALAADYGLKVNPQEIAPPETLVLAIKPQMLDKAAEKLSLIAGPDTLVVSVLAGKTIANLQARLPAARAFARVMPNTPAAVGRGAAAGVANAAVSARQKAWTERLMRAVGVFEWVEDERLIDAVTALSGSGPAYVFALVEAMAKAGEAVGLPPDLAMRLARATVEGAGELMHGEPGVSAAQLRINVTSPAGTTAAALAILQAPDGLEPLVVKAIAAAHRRAGELAG
jgi:pyrroline-5-carboxylate reductase